MDTGIADRVGQRELFRSVPEVKISCFRVDEEITLYPGDVLQISGEPASPEIAVSVIRGPGRVTGYTVYKGSPPRLAGHTDEGAVSWLPPGMDTSLIPLPVVGAVRRILLNARGDDRPKAVRQAEIGWAVYLIQKSPGISTRELFDNPSLGCPGEIERRRLRRILEKNAENLGLIYDMHNSRHHAVWTWVFVDVPPPAPRAMAQRTTGG